MHRLSTENAQLKRDVEELEAALDELLAEKNRVESEVSALHTHECTGAEVYTVSCWPHLTRISVFLFYQSKDAKGKCQRKLQALQDGLTEASKPLPELV